MGSFSIIHGDIWFFPASQGALLSDQCGQCPCAKDLENWLSWGMCLLSPWFFSGKVYYFVEQIRYMCLGVSTWLWLMIDGLAENRSHYLSNPITLGDTLQALRTYIIHLVSCWKHESLLFCVFLVRVFWLFDLLFNLWNFDLFSFLCW